MKYELVDRTQGLAKPNDDLVDAADGNVLLAQLLAARGITDPEEARAFLKPDMTQLLDPFGFSDMANAVALITEAVKTERSIWIHGDYDADGTSGSAILARALQRMGADPQVYIPQRTGTGYGLSQSALETMPSDALLITVDCGIRNTAEIDMAQRRGMAVIVTDHHTCPEIMPGAACILNPKRPGELYANKNLCGAGVAFKLAQALLGAENAMDFLDLAAFATIADVVPLLGENRAIVALGLERMDKAPSPGIAALKSVRYNSYEPLTASSVAYDMVPVVNAAGRMSSARMAFDLLAANKFGGLTDVLLKTLIAENDKRKKLQAAVLLEAEKTLEAMQTFPKFIFLADRNWPLGVLGPAAARLAEKYRRPAALFAWHNGAYVGSARATEGVDLYEVLSASEHLMDKFGGHREAAGMTVRDENLWTLDREVQEYMTHFEEGGTPAYKALRVAEYDFEPELPVSAETMEALAKMEPYGCANPQPLALFRKTKIQRVRRLGKAGDHAAFEIGEENRSIRAVMFGIQAADVPPIADVVGELKMNARPGHRGQVETIVRALSAEAREAAYLRLAVRALQADGTPSNPRLFFRDRQRMGAIYSAFRLAAPDGRVVTLLELYQMSRSKLRDLVHEEAAFAYAVFAELGLIEDVADGRIKVVPNVRKTSLDDSEIYKKCKR